MKEPMAFSWISTEHEKQIFLRASRLVSKKYTQRIEHNNLNLRTNIKRLEAICFSRLIEINNKVIN